jgi:hypothetical protein
MCGGNQHPGIRPEPRGRLVLELPDIDIEHDAVQVIAFKRISEGILVDDLAPGDIDEHAPRLHRGEPVLVEEAVRLPCMPRQACSARRVRI